MNDDDMAQNAQVGEEANFDTTPVLEEQATEEVTPVESTETTVEVAETGESHKGASARIKELNTRAKTAEERVQSLEEKLAELTRPVGLPGDAPFIPQEQIIAPGEEIDANEFQKRVLAQADARTELKIRQSEAVNRINTEANEVLRLYPELDPDNEAFNKALSDSVSKQVEKLVKANPYTTSVKQEVKEIMSLYNGGITAEVGKATENIARQVSEAALRPTSVKSSEKPDSEMSTEELEKKYGIIY